jgi:hypothetical protein
MASIGLGIFRGALISFLHPSIHPSFHPSIHPSIHLACLPGCHGVIDGWLIVWQSSGWQPFVLGGLVLI